MNRNWKALSPEEPLSREDLDRLLNGKTKLVVKPLTSYGGKGVEVLDTAERFASPEECLDYLNGLKKRYIAEEYVEQKGFIHDLNPSSVNTVRIVTVQHPGGELELKNAYLRVGREGSPVDNVTSGGWFYVIDHRTGMMREGRDRKDQCIVRYRKGKDPAPVKVPRWEEAVEFCLSAHRHAPEGLNYIGWGLVRIISERPGATYWYLRYLPLMPAYSGWFMRFARTTAQLSELFFFQSYKDNWNPYKTSRSAQLEKI